MTQKDKELLLKDLCARLFYGVKVLYEGQVKEIQYIEPLYNELKLLDFSNYTIGIEEIKPYLRPMSSMTEEEKFILSLCNAFIEPRSIELKIDFYNQQHLDYRGLIEKGLAIEVTKENNPYENQNKTP